MVKFIKHYALEIYTVFALVFVVFTAMMGELSVVQKLVVIDSVIFILHEWEEGRYPGGFVDMIAGMLQREISLETKLASRIPAGILLLTFSIVPFIYHETPLFTMVLVAFGFFETFAHTMGTRLFHTSHFYTPGLVTALMELVVSIVMLTYLITNQLGHWQDYVFGPLIMFVCYIILQRTMTLMVGVKYSEMPKLIKAQWKKEPGY